MTQPDDVAADEPQQDPDAKCIEDDDLTPKQDQ